MMVMHHSLLRLMSRIQELPKDTSTERDGTNPDAVLARVESLKETVFTAVGLKSFYKPYSTWSKLKLDQLDKA